MVAMGGVDEVGSCAGDVVTVDDGPGEVDTVDDGPGEVVTVEDTGGVVAGAEVVGGVEVLPPLLSASAGTAMPTAPSATAPATITIRLRTF